MKKIINTDKAPLPIGPYNQAVQFGNMLFVSGQIALSSEGKILGNNIEEETEIVMQNIGNILTEAGYNYGNIIKSSIFIKDMNQFALINGVYGEYFDGMAPARETVEVARLPKDANVEISIIAAK